MVYDFLIVGAGMFGSVCARQLHDAGFSVVVIDRRDHIAGNCFTYKQENIDVHKYGAHIFHTDSKEIWDYINKFSEFTNFINSPVAVYKGKTYNLPFNMNTFTQLYGSKTVEEIKEIIEKETVKYKNKNPKNLEEKAIKLVGKKIYKTLIKGYTQKQWGRKCTELNESIITRLPVRFTYDNNYFNDKYQGIPKNGYTEVFKNMLDGIEVKLNTDYKTCGIEYKKMIYTGTIDGYFNYSLGKLPYRSLEFKNEILPIENYQGNAVINYTEEEIPYTRIIEHKHFNKETVSDKTIISKEYPIEYMDDTTQVPYYPIPEDKNKDLYKKYKELSLSEKNVIFGGRLGSYQYYDMDDTIASALQLTKKLCLEKAK
jgi:UDP-galactopyranose mutase